jgi:hypothetical protein
MTLYRPFNACTFIILWECRCEYFFSNLRAPPYGTPVCCAILRTLILRTRLFFRCKCTCSVTLGSLLTFWCQVRNIPTLLHLYAKEYSGWLSVQRSYSFVMFNVEINYIDNCHSPSLTACQTVLISLSTSNYNEHYPFRLRIGNGCVDLCVLWCIYKIVLIKNRCFFIYE